MKRVLFIGLIVISLLSCKRTQYKEVEARMYRGMPRNVEYMRVGVGITHQDDYFNYDLMAAWGEEAISSSDFSLTIQTSNYPSGDNWNSLPFFEIWDFFKYGETEQTFYDYISAPLESFEEILASQYMLRYVPEDQKDYSFPRYLYEYRTDGVEDIEITCDLTLFGKEAGEDLSDKFEIALFNANRCGLLAYIMSYESGEFQYVVEKGRVVTIDNFNQTPNKVLENITGKELSPSINKNIPLNDWVELNPLVEPSIFLKLKETPSELPSKVVFTVKLTTSQGKVLTASTPMVYLIN